MPENRSLPYRHIAAALALGAALSAAALHVRRSARRRELIRDACAAPAPDEARAWTADGYIKDQDALRSCVYRTMPASINGCGPVAAYNLRRRAGQDAAFADVLDELDAMHPFRAPGPTLMRVMRRYLRRYLPGGREARGRRAAVAAAARSEMGVFRYLEQGVPHFVAYFRAPGGFRFFNVSDDTEDAVLPMASFAAAHLRGGSVKLIWWA